MNKVERYWELEMWGSSRHRLLHIIGGQQMSFKSELMPSAVRNSPREYRSVKKQLFQILI